MERIDGGASTRSGEPDIPHRPLAGLADLSDLRQLKLNSTLLTGPIPAGLGNLPNLEFLELVFNERLIGSIPSRLRDLRLAKLDLMGTPVCVPADAEFQTWLGAIDDFPLPGADVRGTRARGVDRDLAVFYTPAALSGAGGTAAIETVIDLMLAETNEAYKASGVDLRVALSTRQELPYVEADSGVRRTVTWTRCTASGTGSAPTSST